MNKALSLDLRDQLIAAIEGGMSYRQAAARFGVSAPSAIRWRSRLRAQSDVGPGPLGGDRRSGRIERHADVILGLVERKSDVTLAELWAAPAEQGVATSLSSPRRFFVLRRNTLRKSRRTRTNRAVPTS